MNIKRQRNITKNNNLVYLHCSNDQRRTHHHVVRSVIKVVRIQNNEQFFFFFFVSAVTGKCISQLQMKARCKFSFTAHIKPLKVIHYTRKTIEKSMHKSDRPKKVIPLYIHDSF